MPRVALVTYAGLPDLHDDDQRLLEPLRRRGIDPVPVVWDDPAAGWDDFDLVILRSPWDYIARRHEFLAWAHSVPQLVNPAKLVEWNTDKTYLADLASAGVPVVPATTWICPNEDVALPASGEYVIKPSVSIGSRDAGRYRFDEPGHHDLAAAHIARLTGRGATVLLQPYIGRVDTLGETAVLHIGAEYSHAVCKRVHLDGPDDGTGASRPAQIEPREASAAEREVAALALAAIPVPAAELLYARVDLVQADDGSPLVLELELSEPRLFFGASEQAAERFAAAVAASL